MINRVIYDHCTSRKILFNQICLLCIVFKLKRNYSNRYIKQICFALWIFRVSTRNKIWKWWFSVPTVIACGTKLRELKKKKKTYIIVKFQTFSHRYTDTSVQCCLQGQFVEEKSAIKVAREEWGGKFFFSLKVCASFHFLGGVYCTLQQHGVRETGRRANAMQHYTKLPSNLNKPCTPAFWKCTPRTAWHR